MPAKVFSELESTRFKQSMQAFEKGCPVSCAFLSSSKMYSFSGFPLPEA